MTAEVISTIDTLLSITLIGIKNSIYLLQPALFASNKTDVKRRNIRKFLTIEQKCHILLEK